MEEFSCVINLKNTLKGLKFHTMIIIRKLVKIFITLTVKAVKKIKNMNKFCIVGHFKGLQLKKKSRFKMRIMQKPSIRDQCSLFLSDPPVRYELLTYMCRHKHAEAAQIRLQITSCTIPTSHSRPPGCCWVILKDKRLLV